MAAAEEQGVKLKAQLTLLNGITIIVGSIIGSGIFVSPTGVQEYVGSVGASLIVWTIGGIVSMIGAYCYSELGCMIRQSGGDYAYLVEAFGGIVAFLRLWIDFLIVRPVVITVMALTFANYLATPIFNDCSAPDTVIRIFALLAIVLLTFINCRSVKLALRVQEIFTYGKLIAVVIIVVTGIVQLARGYNDSFLNIWSGSSTNPADYVFALYSGLFAYAGWQFLNFVIEEMENPKRDLPKAIGISIVICTGIYVFANVSYYTVLSPVEMLATPAVAITFAKNLYPGVWWIMSLFVSLSCFGSMNGVMFTSARLNFVAARNGHMPKLLAMVQQDYLTPAPACLFVGFLATMYLVSTNILALINYLSFALWLTFLMAIVALFYFRWKHPDWERPVKVHLVFPIIFLLVCIVLVIIPIITKPADSALGIIIILSGVPVYWICVSWKNKPKGFAYAIGWCTVFLQKLLVVVPVDDE